MNDAQNPFQINWNDGLLVDAMMFLYKTRHCPFLKKNNHCEHGDSCFDAHIRGAPRRRPCKTYSQQWNYSHIKKCLTGYPNMPEQCSHGKGCYEYHATEEANYHPLNYKTRECRDLQFQKTGICSRGLICWEFHNNMGDRRDIRKCFIAANIQGSTVSKQMRPPQQFQDYLQYLNNKKQSQPQQQPQPHDVIDQKDLENNMNNNNNMNMNNNKNNNMNMNNMNMNNNNNMNNMNMSDRKMEFKDDFKDNGHRSPQILTAHKQWLDHIQKFYRMFKNKRCSKGNTCPPGINCMDYHSSKDKRRLQEHVNYSEKACPNLWDYKTKQFDLENKTCPQGDVCKYSHNFYEAWYHQNSYKLMTCPYLKLSKMSNYYTIKECPFDRKEEWFKQCNVLQEKNPFKKVKGNMVILNDKQHLCLDYCPFYHSSRDQRFNDDPNISYYQKSKSVNNDNRSQKSYSQPQNNNNNNQNASSNNNDNRSQKSYSQPQNNNNNNQNGPSNNNDNRSQKSYSQSQNNNQNGPSNNMSQNNNNYNAQSSQSQNNNNNSYYNQNGSSNNKNNNMSQNNNNNNNNYNAQSSQAQSQNNNNNNYNAQSQNNNNDDLPPHMKQQQQQQQQRRNNNNNSNNMSRNMNGSSNSQSNNMNKPSNSFSQSNNMSRPPNNNGSQNNNNMNNGSNNMSGPSNGSQNSNSNNNNNNDVPRYVPPNNRNNNGNNNGNNNMNSGYTNQMNKTDLQQTRSERQEFEGDKPNGDDDW